MYVFEVKTTNNTHLLKCKSNRPNESASIEDSVKLINEEFGGDIQEIRVYEYKETYKNKLEKVED